MRKTRARPVVASAVFAVAFLLAPETTRMQGGRVQGFSQQHSVKTPERKLDTRIQNLGKQGKTDEAIRVYDTIPEPSLREMNAVVDALSRAERIREAREFVEQMPQTNVYTFGALMNGLSRAKLVDQAVELLHDMPVKFNVKPNAVVYNAAIAACAKANPPQTRRALQILKQQKDPNIVGYNSVLFAASRAGDVEMAFNLFDEMNEKQNPPPDQLTYATILSTLEKAEEWERLLKFAEFMREKGLQLDVLALTSVLHACQQLGLAQEAIKYLRLYSNENISYEKQTSRDFHKRRLPTEPDAVVYRLAISACARGGAWKDGVLLLEEYIQRGSEDKNSSNARDVVAYTAAITGCEYVGEWKAALGLLDRMRRAGAEPNEVTFCAILGACAKACSNMNVQELEDKPTPLLKAMQLLKILQNDPAVVSPNVQIYNAAIRVCAEAMDLNQAFAIFNEMQKASIEPTIITFGTLMTACERVGDIDSVNKVFNMIRDASLEPNEVVYGAAISACRKTNEWKRGTLLLRKMLREGLRPNTAVFNTVLSSLAGSNQLDEAILVYKILKKGSYSSARPNRQTYSIMIGAFVRSKKPREAHLLLNSMRYEGMSPDVDLYTSTISAYEKNGQPLQALRLMESMRAEGYDFYEPNLLNSAFKRGVRILSAVGNNWNEEMGSDLDWTASDDDILKELNQTISS